MEKYYSLLAFLFVCLFVCFFFTGGGAVVLFVFIYINGLNSRSAPKK